MRDAAAGHNKYPMKSAVTDYLLGMMVGLSLTLPLLGRVAGLPSSAVALIFPLMSMLMCLASGPVISRRLLSFVGLLSLYGILVLQSAHAEQFAFFLYPSKWMQNANHYFEAQLIMVVIAAVPGALAAACFVATPGEQKNRGLRDAFIFSAVLVLLSLLRFSDLLIATSFERAVAYFRSSSTTGHSAVLYGVILCIGTAATMNTRLLWMLSSFFLVALFLIGRRVELLVAVMIVLACCGLPLFQNRLLRNPDVWRFVPVFLLAGALVLPLHNEVSLMRWTELSHGISERTDMVSSSFRAAGANDGKSGKDKLDSPHGEQLGVNRGADRAHRDDRSDATKILLGRGLGWYSTLGFDHPYPHNYILSTFLESGAIAALIAVTVIGFGIVVPLRAGPSPMSFMLAAVTASMFLTCLKAGDASFGVRVLCFALLSATFPYHANRTAKTSL